MQELTNWLYFTNTDNNGKRLHRQCMLLSSNDALQRAKQLVSDAPASVSVCWLGASAPDNAFQLPSSEYRKLLGQEFDVAVYDAFTPFRPSALLALAGTLRSGGRLIIACPPFADWPTCSAVLDTHFVSHGWQLTHSRYLSHWIDMVLNDPAVAIADNKVLHLPVVYGEIADSPTDQRFKTSDQLLAFNALMESGGSAVLTAPRGRGKTALLGEIALALLASGKEVLLTSKHYDSLLPLISRLNKENAISKIKKGCFRHTDKNTTLKWVATDNAVLYSKHNAIVIIDEAASLPLPLLHSILAFSSRSILATTTDGYEGSGQGFVQRFIPSFLSRTQANHYRLATPIRWLENDPLERLTSRGLLFSTEKENRSKKSALLVMNWRDFSTLDTKTVHSVMQLLTQAHYQTSPDDLMRLMDAPDIKLLIAQLGDTVIGATVINIEGGPRLANVASGIASGIRRVKGHLSAQRIALALTDPVSATQCYWRINRIAVSWDQQRNSYGSQMLNKVIHDAARCEVDAVTSSFGYTDPLARFWQKNGLEVVQHGIKKDKASGNSSSLVYRAISQKAEIVLSALRSVKAQEDNAMAKGTKMVPAINQQPSYKTTFLAKLNLTKLQQFIEGSRDTTHCIGSLHWLACQLAYDGQAKSDVLQVSTLFPLLSYLQNHAFDIQDIQRRGFVATKSELKHALQTEVKRALTQTELTKL